MFVCVVPLSQPNCRDLDYPLDVSYLRYKMYKEKSILNVEVIIYLCVNIFPVFLKNRFSLRTTFYQIRQKYWNSQKIGALN